MLVRRKSQVLVLYQPVGREMELGVLLLGVQNDAYAVENIPVVSAKLNTGSDDLEILILVLILTGMEIRD